MATVLADIVNMALDALNGTPNIGGSWGITAAELTTPTTPQGTIASRNYLQWIKEVMREVEWSSLASRAQLIGNGTTTLTFADTTTPGAFAPNDTVTITPAVAYFTSKDVGRLLFEQAIPPATTSGLNGTARITAVSADPIPVATATINFAFTSAGFPVLAVQGWGLAPLLAFKRAYQLPSDSLKIRALLDATGEDVVFFTSGGRGGHGAAETWMVEGQFVLTDLVQPVALYTAYDSNPDDWDQGLREAVVAKIAAELAWPLTKNEKVKADLFTIYRKKLAEADSETKEERQRRRYSPTTFLDVRR